MKKIFLKGLYLLSFMLFTLGLYNCEGKNNKTNDVPSKWYLYYLSDGWKEMTKQSSNTFIYEEEWTFPWYTEEGWSQRHVIVASEPGNSNTYYYFEEEEISGYEKVRAEDKVQFIFDPSTHTLSVELLSPPSKWYFYYQSDDWSEMTQKSSNTFIYEEEWTFPWCTEEGWSQSHVIVASNTENSKTYNFFDYDEISGYEKVQNGDKVQFIFNSSTHALSVKLLSQGGGGGTTSKPSTPTGVSASASSSYILVEWNSVSSASYYYVYRSTTASGSYSYLGKANDTYYTDYDASAGTTYYYKVSAVNSAGESSMSSYASAKINSSGGGGGGSTSSKPSTPSGITADASSSYILIEWNSVSSASYYYVYRSTSASGSYSYLAKTYNTYYSDYDASAGTTYYYKVSAVNDAGESSMSSYASAKISSGGGGGSGGGGTTNYEPCPPTVTCSGTSSVTVKWTASTGTGCGKPTSYDVKRMNRITGQAETLKSGTTSISYTDSQPFPGINIYGVTAKNDYGSDTGQNYSSSIGIAAPSFTDGISADSHEVFVDIKGLSVPDSWKPYYTLELYWSTSYSGYYTKQAEWNYYDYRVSLGSNAFGYTYDFGNSIDFSGKTYYYKLRWVFEAPHSPSRVEGNFTSVKSVTHKR